MIEPGRAVGRTAPVREALGRAGQTEHLYPALLLVALVFLVVVPWHAVNRRLPIWDAADFVLTAQMIVERFELDRVDGMRALYDQRGWRPIAFPSLAAPAFALADGRILAGVAITMYAAVLLLAAYVYRLLRLWFTSPRALLGSGLLVSAPWVVNFSQAFYAEIVWVAAAAGLFHHVLAARRHHAVLQFVTAGAWFGVMAALRPIETALLTVLPAMGLVAIQWKHRAVHAADVALFATQLVMVGVATWLLALPGEPVSWPLWLLAGAAVVVAAGARNLFFRSPVIGGLVAAEAVGLAWHLPSLRALYFWAYDTSFGPLAQLSDRKFSGLAPWSVFWELVQRYSPELLVALSAMAAVGLLSWRRAAPGSDERPAAIGILAAALLMMLPMIILLSLSGTSDMRRIMPGVLGLHLGALVLALTPHGFVPRLRTALLIGLMAAQVVSATLNGLNLRIPVVEPVRQFTGPLRHPFVGQDPHAPVLDGILGLGIREGRISAYTYCYRDYATCERLGMPMFEPMALSTLAKERDLPIHVHFIGALRFDDPETVAAQIRLHGFQYVLVDMFDAPEAVNWDDPLMDHTKRFIAYERDGLPPGLIDRGCFSTLNRPICVLEVAR